MVRPAQVLNLSVRFIGSLEGFDFHQRLAALGPSPVVKRRQLSRKNKQAVITPAIK
jgi:hypothetical protein